MPAKVCKDIYNDVIKEFSKKAKVRGLVESVLDFDEFWASGVEIYILVALDLPLRCLAFAPARGFRSRSW